MRILFAIAVFMGIVLQCNAQAVSSATKSANKKFNKLQFEKAANAYNNALQRKTVDSVYIQEQLGNCYRLMNDPAVAEFWYKKAVENGSRKPDVIFQLAQMLRMNMRYEESRKYYEQYKRLVPSDASVDDIIIGLGNMKELFKDRGVYTITPVSFNTNKSDISATYFTDSSLLIVSNRKGKISKSLSNDWKNRSFNKGFVVSDSTSSSKASVKKVKKGKALRKCNINSVTVNRDSSEIIFASSKFKKENQSKSIHLKLYNMPYPPKGKKSIVELPFNSDTFSNSNPAFSADGNTLFFASDRAGGFGGSDLYKVERVNGTWGTPQNLGKEINTAHDEKFPFAAKDGTLYFSSNGFDGLGGLDIYKSSFDGNKWKRPENLAAPVNSNLDDFAFLINDKNEKGFFTSNRSGGAGEDDIYSFNFDESKLDYKMLVKVINANTKQQIQNAEVILLCNATTEEKFKTDAIGEARVVVKGGKKCTLEVFAARFKTTERIEIAREKAGVIEISLKPDLVKLIVAVKEAETGLPLNDAAISFIGTDNAEVTFVTGNNGKIEASIAPDDYKVYSRDYSTISDKFSTADADINTNSISREYVISKKDFTVNLPLSANCFSSSVKVTDLKSGEVYEVKPNAAGEVRLDLRLNQKYIVEHNLRKDTISTSGLFPGDEISGICKFKVGQKWIVKNIFYDLNKSEIRKDAAAQLDNLVRVMNENPSLEIELSAHTDCRQTRAYNNQLSLQRAKAAIDYIVGKGIRLKRLVAAGFGETRLVNDCTCEPKNDSPCTEDQHQANRRTEVKVLKY